MNIRYPNITGASEREQLAQIRSYLRQLVDELNYALPSIGTGGGSGQTMNPSADGQAYYELRSFINNGLREVEDKLEVLNTLVNEMKGLYVPNSGWDAGMHLVTDADGNVTTENLIEGASQNELEE